MEKLIGWQLDKLPLNLRLIIHLEYFEGPLLSLFENEYGDSYLYSWCDIDELYNRWLVFRVVPETLKQYVEGKVSLRELLLNPIDGFLYSLDIDDTLQILNVYLLQPKTLPKNYIPDTDSYYSFLELNSETRENDKILIQKKLHDDEFRVLIESLKTLLVVKRKGDISNKSINYVKKTPWLIPSNTAFHYDDSQNLKSKINF